MGFQNILGFGKRGGSDRVRILHIDDSQWIRIPVGMVLRTHFNAVALEASDGESGLHLAEAEMPDLILLDIMMVPMDGFECLARLKKNPRTRDIPVVMCSSKDQVREVNIALQLGALDFVTKPIEEDVLIQKINQVLQAAGKLRSPDGAPPPGRRLPGDPSSTERLIPSGSTMPEASSPASPPPPPPPKVEQRPCPLCQLTMTFIADYSAWYCYHCQKYPDYGPSSKSA